jgi:hypothetical protein
MTAWWQSILELMINSEMFIGFTGGKVVVDSTFKLRSNPFIIKTA